MEFLEKFADVVRLNSLSVAVAIEATAIAVFGGYINSFIKLVTKRMHFLVRFGCYILVYAFGIGILSAKAVSFLQKFFLTLPALHLLFLVAAAFLLLCFMAKRQRHI